MGKGTLSRNNLTIVNFNHLREVLLFSADEILLYKKGLHKYVDKYEHLMKQYNEDYTASVIYPRGFQEVPQLESTQIVECDKPYIQLEVKGGGYRKQQRQFYRNVDGEVCEEYADIRTCGSENRVLNRQGFEDFFTYSPDKVDGLYIGCLGRETIDFVANKKDGIVLSNFHLPENLDKPQKIFYGLFQPVHAMIAAKEGKFYGGYFEAMFTGFDYKIKVDNFDFGYECEQPSLFDVMLGDKLLEDDQTIECEPVPDRLLVHKNK